MTIIETIILLAFLWAVHGFWCWVLDGLPEANGGRRRAD